MNSADPTVHKKPIVYLIVLTLTVTLLYIAGATLFNYNIMLRTSEDAYASMLLRRAATGANQIQERLSWLISELTSFEHPSLAEPATPANQRLNAMREKYEPLLLAAATYDNQGQQTHLSACSNSANLLPPQLFDNFADPISLRHKGEPWMLEKTATKDAQPAIIILAPIGKGTDWHGATGIAISLAALDKQFLTELRDSDSVFCWLSGTNQILVGAMPDDDPNNARPSEERDLILDDGEHKQLPYKVTESSDGRRLAVYAQVHVLNHKWTVGLSMLWGTVRLAPHALFKGTIILAAWVLPIIAILVLFSIRALLLATASRERNVLRQELDDAQSKLLILIESLPEAICLINPEEPTTPAFVSHRIETITGHSALELMTDPKAWVRLIHPDDRTTFNDNRQKAFKEPVSVIFDYRIQHRAGHWIAIKEYTAPVLDSSNKATQLLSVLTIQTDQNNLIPTKQISNPAQMQPMPQTNQTHNSRKSRILLVDDDRLLVSLFSKALKRLGYGITGAYHGLQAVEIFTEHPEDFDVIILDMVMPKMSGLEAIKHLRKIRSDIRIIGISGYSTDGKEWDLPKQGVHAFLSKPFDIEDLTKTIDSLAVKKEDENGCS